MFSKIDNIIGSVKCILIRKYELKAKYIQYDRGKVFNAYKDFTENSAKNTEAINKDLYNSIFNDHQKLGGKGHMFYEYGFFDNLSEWQTVGGLIATSAGIHIFKTIALKEGVRVSAELISQFNATFYPRSCKVDYLSNLMYKINEKGFDLPILVHVSPEEVKVMLQYCKSVGDDDPRDWNYVDPVSKNILTFFRDNQDGYTLSGRMCRSLGGVILNYYEDNKIIFAGIKNIKNIKDILIL